MNTAVLPPSVLRRALRLVVLLLLPAVTAGAQTVNRDDILYVMPYMAAYSRANVADMQKRLGEGAYVKVGYSAYVFIRMTDWNVDTSSPAAIREALASTISQIDAHIAEARAAGVPVALSMLTQARQYYDPAQSASEAEDIRNMQWYADNVLAAGWWTPSRYARKQFAVQQAYWRELGKILANRMSLYPDTLVAASGDGEVEMAFARNTTIFADYSPFTVAEFRDWIRHNGLYADGAIYGGQGYSLGARYRNDPSPGTDSTPPDGHTLNGDVGTNFMTWELQCFDWSLSDPYLAGDPHAIPLSAYQGSACSGGVSEGFDAPRDPKAGPGSLPRTTTDPWWNLWVLFKQKVLQQHNTELAKWMTTSPDPETGYTIPPTRWYSYQIPADYLYNGSPSDPNERWFTSMSSHWTADVSPYGSLGITAFNIDFADNPIPFVAYTLKNVAPLIAARDVRWGIIEWNPGELPDEKGYSKDLELYRTELAVVEQYRPSLLQPFIWGALGANQVQDTGFEVALRETIARIKDGTPSDPRLTIESPLPGSTTAPSFSLTGWAVDLGKIRGPGRGPGVDQVNVYAYPNPGLGTAPIFLGAATYGGVRNAVGTAYGSQFTKSGFTFPVKGLRAGRYDIVAYGRSTVTGTFSTSATVSVEVTYAGTASPLGSFDTPAGGATGLQGSFAVTGWALDDVAVDRVELWRDLASGEPASHAYTTDPSHPAYGKVFIANPLFVEGSRPDIETKYSTYPNATRAGWGYLLLSWGLWNQGNGTYTLYAYAVDVEGHRTLLGSKTIAVDNPHATRPFGAIDTPSYGGAVSGGFWNFGWALTPNATPACTIPNGKVYMNIDSGPFVMVDYGDVRTDIAAAFPGLSNGNNSGGAYYVDSTKYSNGTHQIGWLVYDDCNRGDGLGSRFFTVSNPSGDAAAAAAPGVSRRPSLGAPARVVQAPLRRPAASAQTSGGGPIVVRRMNAEPEQVWPNASGTHVVEMPQDGRVEIELPPVPDGASYTGFHDINGGQRALPLGSSLDAHAGVFYWQPAAGFLGSFDLVFSALDLTGSAAEVRVRVVVGPPMRTVIDTPHAEATVGMPFDIAGWTLDLAAADGAGIDTVHVWAYPGTGAPPIWLGVAASGDRRPDVGKAFGAPFDRAGFSLTATSLAPGTYDVVVYPHRTRTNAFEGAASVRLTVR